VDRSVSLSSDGLTVAIGARDAVFSPFWAGSVRIFGYIDGEWVQLGESIIGEAAFDHSGVVSLSGDGSKVAIGAQHNDGSFFEAGHVRIYSLGAVGVSEHQLELASIYPNPSTGIIRIDLNEKVQNVMMNIYSIQGALIQSSNLGVTASSSHILPEPNGLYFIELVSEDGNTQMLKVLKE
jgi:hypothetical protein